MMVDCGGALYLLWTSPLGHLQASKYSTAGASVYLIDLGRGSQWSGAIVTASGSLYTEYVSSTGNLMAAKYNSTGVATYSVGLGVGLRSSGVAFHVTGNLVDPAGNTYLSWISGGTQTFAKY